MFKTDYMREKSRGVPVERMPTMCFCGNGRFSRWDEVRFLAEKAHNMVIYDIEEFEEACKARRRYHIQADSCLVGLLSTDTTVWSQAFMLGEDFDVTTVSKEAVILLVRVPTGQSARGKSKSNTFVPYAHLRELHEAKVAGRILDLKAKLHTTSGEIARLNLIQDIAALEFGARIESRGRFRRASQHPSVDDARERFKGFINRRSERLTWDQVPLPPPEPDYVCGVCRNYFKPAHFSDRCPAADRSDWVPMHKRKPPHGIPGCHRALVSWESPEAEVAAAEWLDFYGQLWRRR
jgi:hypothetical protein